MISSPNNPRVLMVTPEVTYLPHGMGQYSDGLNAKAGGLADVSAALISALYNQGADVHVALPDYRSIFNGNSSPLAQRELGKIRNSVPDERIHLAQDRAFFYLNHIYSGNKFENVKISLAFQREVINNIVPKVQPDLIHCNDWMTALIPAMARQLGIPCLPRFQVPRLKFRKAFFLTVPVRSKFLFLRITFARPARRSSRIWKKRWRT